VEEIFIFANPIAGRGKGRRIAERLAKRLRADGFRVRTAFDRPDSLDASAVAGPVRAAIVIGGDGTLRAVTDRLLELRGDVPPILPVPLGTANLMVRHLGFRWEDATLEETASTAIRLKQIIELDAGRANGKLFLLMVGVGIDGKVVHELDRMRRGPISMLSYVVPAALALSEYDYPALRVVVDGQELWPGSPAVTFVGNVREYGTGFPVLPFARSDDGLLDVCVLPCRSRVELMRLLMQAAVGEHTLGERAAYVRGKNVAIESPGNVPVQIDGDPGGHTPLVVELLPMRLPFIVP
jgi:diacylglycerol kinase (ATP)